MQRAFARSSGRERGGWSSHLIPQAPAEEKGLPAHTTRSIVVEEEYLAELEQVRQKGHSIDNEEYLTGVKAVAVALHNTHGPPMALWVLGLSSTMRTEKIEAAIEPLTDAAKTLRRILDNTTGYKS